MQTKSNIIITGKKGQIGYEIMRVASLLGNVIDEDFDLSKPDEITSVIRKHKPNILINCAAFTSVDTAEDRHEYAMKVNAEAPSIMAEELKKTDGTLIHFSTDFAFDGTKKTPYNELDPVSPISTYAKTKVAGDNAIINSGVKHLIFRTSWIYGTRGKNFLLTLTNLFKSASELHIVNDQVGSPTWSRTLAEGVGLVLAQKESREKEYSGIYNMTAAGAATWYEFAVHISKFYNEKHEKRVTIYPESSGQYPMKAQRPKYAILDNSKLTSTFGVIMPHWSVSFKQAMEDMGYIQPSNYKSINR